MEIAKIIMSIRLDTPPIDPLPKQKGDEFAK